MNFKVQSSPHLDSGTPESKREEIKRYFHDSWDVYEHLFDVMASDEAYFQRADPLRHPIIFYLGHTATFFINKMVLAKVITERVNPRFESIFAIGVDEMSWDDLNEQNYDWPTVAEVWEYRKKVRVVVEQAIDELPLNLPITWEDPFWVIMMGIEHERIHIETSSVLMRQLPLKYVQENSLWPACAESSEAPANDLLDVPGGQVVMGKAAGHALYGWDNEYGTHETQVNGFRAGRFLVSNGEFKKFMDAGGYNTQKWWSEEGWSWRKFRQAEHPTFGSLQTMAAFHCVV